MCNKSIIHWKKSFIFNFGTLLKSLLENTMNPRKAIKNYEEILTEPNGSFLSMKSFRIK